MTIQLLNKGLSELMQIEDRIKRVQKIAEEHGIPLPEEDQLIKELIKASMEK
jgi:type III secretion system FlhB-like substrate exporter